MDIERFVSVRKAKKISQKELSTGICTQATLSRFENNGQVPTLKILLQLCNRLEIPLGDLFPRIGVKQTEIVEQMDKAEFFLITSEYEQLEGLLDTIDLCEVEEVEIMERYYYLKGFLMIFKNAPLTDVLFIFNKLLMDESKSGAKIFRLLAFTGIGMMYAREKELDKAEFYFNQVFEKIYSYPIRSVEDTWRVLNIVLQCGVFFSEVAEIESSNALLKYAISICSDNHVTYYLARAAYQLAKNAIQQGKPKAEIEELLQDARAYAKINNNQILLKEIKKLTTG